MRLRSRTRCCGLRYVHVTVTFVGWLFAFPFRRSAVTRLHVYPLLVHAPRVYHGLPRLHVYTATHRTRLPDSTVLRTFVYVLRLRLDFGYVFVVLVYVYHAFTVTLRLHVLRLYGCWLRVTVTHLIYAGVGYGLRFTHTHTRLVTHAHAHVYGYVYFTVTGYGCYTTHVYVGFCHYAHGFPVTHTVVVTFTVLTHVWLPHVYGSFISFTTRLRCWFTRLRSRFVVTVTHVCLPFTGCLRYGYVATLRFTLQLRLRLHTLRFTGLPFTHTHARYGCLHRYTRLRFTLSFYCGLPPAFTAVARLQFCGLDYYTHYLYYIYGYAVGFTHHRTFWLLILPHYVGWLVTFTFAVLPRFAVTHTTTGCTLRYTVGSTHVTYTRYPFSAVTVWLPVTLHRLRFGYPFTAHTRLVYVGCPHTVVYAVHHTRTVARSTFAGRFVPDFIHVLRLVTHTTHVCVLRFLHLRLRSGYLPRTHVPLDYRCVHGYRLRLPCVVARLRSRFTHALLRCVTVCGLHTVLHATRFFYACVTALPNGLHTRLLPVGFTHGSLLHARIRLRFPVPGYGLRTFTADLGSVTCGYGLHLWVLVYVYGCVAHFYVTPRTTHGYGYHGYGRGWVTAVTVTYRLRFTVTFVHTPHRLLRLDTHFTRLVLPPTPFVLRTHCSSCRCGLRSHTDFGWVAFTCTFLVTTRSRLPVGYVTVVTWLVGYLCTHHGYTAHTLRVHYTVYSSLPRIRLHALHAVWFVLPRYARLVAHTLRSRVTHVTAVCGLHTAFGSPAGYTCRVHGWLPHATHTRTHTVTLHVTAAGYARRLPVAAHVLRMPHVLPHGYRTHIYTRSHVTTHGCAVTGWVTFTRLVGYGCGSPRLIGYYGYRLRLVWLVTRCGLHGSRRGSALPVAVLHAFPVTFTLRLVGCYIYLPGWLVTVTFTHATFYHGLFVLHVYLHHFAVTFHHTHVCCVTVHVWLFYLRLFGCRLPFGYRLPLRTFTLRWVYARFAVTVTVRLLPAFVLRTVLVTVYGSGYVTTPFTFTLRGCWLHTALRLPPATYTVALFTLR